MARNADPAVKLRIAKNLRRVLTERDLSVGQAAKLVKMGPDQMSGYVNGLRGFAVETLLRLAARLDVALDELVRGVDLEYTRRATARQHPALEEDLELMDVVTGFETMRRDNRPEAETVAAVFRARMIGEPVPVGGARDVAPSSAAKVTTPRRAPTVKPRRVARR